MANIDLLADDSHGLVDLLDDSEQQPMNYREFLNQGTDDYFKSAGRIGKNLAAGGLEGLRGIGNIPHKLHLPNAPHFGKTNFSKMMGLPDELNLSDKLIQGMAQFAPAMAIPGANLGRAGKLIESLPKMGKFLRGALEQAIPQAGYGASQNDNSMKGALEGGLGSLAGSAIGKGIGAGINAMRPSQMFKSPLPKKELAKAYQQSKGSNSDLGNTIENPKLQRLYENVLPKYTGDASSMMQKTGQQIVEKGEGILSKLLGPHSSENVPSQLTKKLTDSYKQHQQFKNDIYNSVNDIAEKSGLKLNLNSFAKNAEKYIDAIEDTNILKHEPEAKRILSKLINYKNPVQETNKKGLLVDKSGNPLLNTTDLKYPSLKEANILKGKLGQYAKSFAQSPDPSQRNMANIFKDLSKSLKKDINESINFSGNESLINTYKAAEENYAKNFSPFLDKDVYKFISGNADPETLISKFIVNSRSSDLGQKLSKLSEKLSKSEGAQNSEPSNLLAYGYLSRALDNEGNFNPEKFATSIKQLGPNQLKALFPDKATRKEVLNYKALVNKNPRALKVMFNPLTGQVNSDIAPHALANIIGGITGLAGGGAPGAIVGAALGPMIQSKLARTVTKKLTDPDYRRKFIKALIANKPFDLPKTTNALQKGGAIAAGLSGKDKQQNPMELEVIGQRE